MGNFPSSLPAKTAYLLRSSIPQEEKLLLNNVSEVAFLYDVSFSVVDLEYDHRWDSYLRSQRISLGSRRNQIHWFSIINSLIIVFILTAVFGVILLRALRKDIARYNDLIMSSDETEEFGWKLVHGDVFRKPQHSTVLAALVGSGIQIMGTITAILIIGVIGVGLYPSTGIGKGRLLQLAIMLWSIMGGCGGYGAARFYKLFQSPNWKLTTIRTALIYPAVVFAMFLFLNFFLVIARSSAAAPFSTIFLLMLLWLGVSTPLVFVHQPWSVRPILTCLTGGVLPFGAVFTEFMFLFCSMWLHRTYILFGFLLMVTVILVITCGLVSITLVYYQLVYEDYYWWWRSFLACGSSALFLFGYCIVYLITRLNLAHFTAILMYLMYSLALSYTFFIVTGSIGFISCFLFLRYIYSSIRVD